MPFMGWFHLVCFFTVFCQKIETALGLKGNEKTIKHFSYGHSAYLSISRQLSLIWKATLDRSIYKYFLWRIYRLRQVKSISFSIWEWMSKTFFKANSVLRLQIINHSFACKMKQIKINKERWFTKKEKSKQQEKCIFMTKIRPCSLK
jgi:hypothetical protein